MFRRIGLTYLANGQHVSTVRLPYDTEWPYETLVFKADSASDVDGARYPSRTKAEAGHKRLVRKWRKRAGGIAYHA